MAYAYGSRSYGEGFYGGQEIQYKFSPVAAFVEVYENDGSLKGLYQIGVGNFLGCAFSLDDGGCRDFELNFSTFVDIAERNIIKIKIFDSDDYFFTGVVRTVPLAGSTERKYDYSGFGLNDYLFRINIGDELTYAGNTVREIIVDLLDNVIVPKSPIVKNLSKLSTLSTVITSITFKYIQVNDALDQLKKIANADGNDYLVGVDREGEFIFKARSTDIKATLTVGKTGRYGITDYQPIEADEPKSKLYVLKKDGTFYDSYSSTEDIDIFEQKLTAPDIDDDDIDNWAQGQLIELEKESKQATIDWQIETTNPTVLDADGTIRIISNIPPATGAVQDDFFGQGLFGEGLFGGNAYGGYDVDDTLKIKDVLYKIADTGAMRTIKLGSLPVKLDREIITIRQNIEDLRVSLGR